jgi:hypothetical protein
MAKYLVIRHDGNGVILGSGISVEDLKQADFDGWQEQGGDEDIVCTIPVKKIPKKVIRILSKEV